jgi:hypothetical protein
MWLKMQCLDLKKQLTKYMFLRDYQETDINEYIYKIDFIIIQIGDGIVPEISKVCDLRNTL